MVNKERYIGLGIDQDTAPDKRKPDTYYDAENVRIVNTGRNLSISAIKAAAEYIAGSSFPDDTVSYNIVGNAEVNDKLYLFLASNPGTPIYTPPGAPEKSYLLEIDGTTITTILYNDGTYTQFNLYTSYYLEVIANYENENIIKLYWTDGTTLFKSINVEDPSQKVDIVQEITISQPTVTLQAGGNLLAGNIQYAYSLYNLNGQESLLSPLSIMTPLMLDMKGYESNQSTGLSCTIGIDIDSTWVTDGYIKVYSIHYLELNQTPKITVITDEKLTSTTYTCVDDGNASVATLSDLELQVIGGRPFIVGTLAAKRNRLFIANYKANNFDPDIDCRVFSHSTASSYTEYRVKYSDGTDPYGVRDDFTTDLPEATHDCVNYDYGTYKYIRGSASLGAEGYNFVLYITESSTNLNTKQSFKRGEIYRFGVIFYDQYGQKSPVHWLCDYKMPYGTRSNRIYARLDIVDTDARLRITSEGTAFYQLTVVERKSWDRTIVSQGFLVPAAEYLNNGADRLSPYLHPYYAVKDIYISNTAGLVMGTSFTLGKDWTNPGSSYNDVVEHDDYMFFYSTDTILENDMPVVDHVIPIGTNFSDTPTTDIAVLKRVYNIGNSAWGGEEYFQGLQLDSWTTYQGLSYFMDTLNVDYIPFIHFKRNYTSASINGVNNTPITLDKDSVFVPTGGTKNIGSEVVSNNVIITQLLKDGTYAAYYKHKFPGSVILKFSSTTWHQTTAAWTKFCPTADTYRRIPIVDLYKEIANQYGGNSYEVKQRNEYLLTGTLAELIYPSNVSDIYGDVWVGPLLINRCDGENYLGERYWNIYEYLRVSYMEHNHNIYARSDLLYEWSNGIGWNVNYQYYRIADLHKLLGAYNQKPTLIKAYSKPITFQTVDTFVNIVQTSQEKFPNEIIDSWLKFPVNENRYLEGMYGKINKLYNFQGEIFVFQDNAVAILSINPRIQTQATDGVNIELGIGAVLYDHKYLTTVAGCTNKYSVVDDGKMLYYYDSKINTINVVEDDKLSSLLGVKTLLDGGTLGSLLNTVYHRKLDEVLFVFSNTTLVYNIVLKRFTHKLTHETGFQKKYVIYRDKLLYLNIVEDILDALYEKYTGTDYLNSFITYLMCPNPVQEKVFHNLEYRLQGNDFTNIFVENDLNQSGVLVPDTKNKFDIMRLHIPRMSNSMNRFRGYFIKVKLSNTAYFSLDDMVLMYNIKG